MPPVGLRALGNSDCILAFYHPLAYKSARSLMLKF
jgi:hypothetical protein